MKKLVALGTLVAALLSYFLGGLTGLVAMAMLVVAAVICYPVARKVGLARAILLVAFILSFVLGGFVGMTMGPKLPGRIARADEVVLFVIGGTMGLMAWLLVVLSVFLLCSEVIFVSHGGDRWESFVYLVNSLLFERAGALEIVDRGEVRIMRSKGAFAPFRAIGYVVIHHGNAVVFERFGQPSQVASPGLVVKKPFERIRAVVDLTRQIENRTEKFFTKDGIPVTIEIKVGFQINSGERLSAAENKEAKEKDMYRFSAEAVLKAVYIVPDWKTYTMETSLALLRDMVCKHYLNEIYDPLKKLSSKRGGKTCVHRLRDRLQASLSEIALSWGVKIHEVKLDIAAPKEIEEQALALEKAIREEQIEVQKAEAENKRIKEFMSRTGGDVTDYAILRYLEKIGEAGIVPPSLERMLLDDIERKTSRPSRMKMETEADEEETG